MMRRAFSKPTSSEEDFESLMHGFRDAGYEGLQLKRGQYLKWLSDPDAYLQAWGDDEGRAATLIYMDSLEPEGADKLSKVIGFAQHVGSERVVFCHRHPRADVTRDQLVSFAGTLSSFGREASDRGVLLSLHHHYDHPVMYRDDFDVFFDAVEPGTVGLTIDTAHLAKSGIEDLRQFTLDFGSVIDNVHLKDFADGEWRLLGQGDLDLDGVIQALESNGYSGWLCVDEESKADLQTGLNVSANWLQTRQH